MAEDVTARSVRDEAAAPALLGAIQAKERGTSRRERARSTAYRVRFAIVYVLLAAVLGGAVGLLFVLATRPETAEGPSWSDWRPEGSRDAMMKQIADRVSKGYRLPSGNQLVAVLVGPPTVQDVTVRAIAVRPDTSTGQAEEGDYKVFEAESSIMYILCGLGERCSIPEGEPTEARHQLLRREALELALYSFKYLDDVGSVVVYLPPRADADPAEVPGSSVFLEKADLRAELEEPLAETLASAKPPELGAIQPAELVTIERLTRPRIFQYEFQQAQEGSAILILTPLTIAAGE